VSIALTLLFLSVTAYANRSAVEELVSYAFILYAPTGLVVFWIFEMLGPMHKSWAVLAFFIAITAQNGVMWFIGKWILSRVRGRAREV
jgi:hypothetical protein